MKPSEIWDKPSKEYKDATMNKIQDIADKLAEDYNIWFSLRGGRDWNENTNKIKELIKKGIKENKKHLISDIIKEVEDQKNIEYYELMEKVVDVDSYLEGLEMAISILKNKIK